MKSPIQKLLEEISRRMLLRGIREQIKVPHPLSQSSQKSYITRPKRHMKRVEWAKKKEGDNDVKRSRHG
jgi:hypothetical protein